jgi:hypothetical protein
VPEGVLSAEEADDCKLLAAGFEHHRVTDSDAFGR